MTTIHNITYYDHRLKLAHVLFLNCNLSCRGCSRKATKWDWHLPLVDVSKLEKVSLKLLKFEDFRNLMLKIDKEYGLKQAVLGGGEPSIDSELCDIVSFLSSRGIEVTLETNAYALSKDLVLKLVKVGLSKAVVSIKAYNDEKHHFYTGVSVVPILKNFRSAYEAGVSLSAVSVFIPNLIEYDEIEDVAKFISSIDPNIAYTIIPYIPVPNAPWRQPSVNEVKKAVNVAKKYLTTVNIDKRVNRPILISTIYPELSW